MKPNPKQPRAKARVMRMSHNDSSLLYRAEDSRRAPLPVLVVPCSSLSEARRLKKWLPAWLDKTEEEKVELATLALANWERHRAELPPIKSIDAYHPLDANKLRLEIRAVLSAIQGGKGK